MAHLPRWRFSRDTRLTFRPPAAPPTANSVLRLLPVSVQMSRVRYYQPSSFPQIFLAFLEPLL